METFDYSAFDRTGNRLTGSVAASSSREARDILRARDLSPVELKQVKSKEAKQQSFGRKVKHRDLTQATRQLAILIDAATPVEEALKVVALQFEKSPMRSIMMDVRSRVMEGSRLADAMGSHPRTFSNLYTAMVGSGEASGQLASVLDRLAVDLESAQEVRNKIVGAVAYPAVLTVVAVIVIILLMVFLVPTLIDQFDTIDQQLPPLTRFVVGFSNFLIKYGIFVAAAIVLLVLGIRQALKNEALQLRWSNGVLRIPLLGQLIQSVNAARFARTMAGLLDSGTPALASMEAEYLEGDFNRVTTVFLNILNPMIIVLLSIVVLIVIFAMYMPMLQMVSL